MKNKTTDVTHLSYSEKKEIINKIKINYWKNELKLSCRENSLMVSEGQASYNGKVEQPLKECIEYNAFIDAVLNQLGQRYKQIIENDYIKKCEDKMWWNNMYRRSTYYRMRSKAVNEFLSYVL